MHNIDGEKQIGSDSLYNPDEPLDSSLCEYFLEACRLRYDYHHGLLAIWLQRTKRKTMEANRQLKRKDVFNAKAVPPKNQTA